MPLKLNVGLSKKLGLPAYGSLGASCHVECELDGSLLEQDVDRFQQHVQKAYHACWQAVSQELARRQSATSNGAPASGPSEARANGQARSPSSASGPQRASDKQLEYALQLAVQVRGLGARRLETLSEKMFAKPLADLTSLEASQVIDVLKELKAGKLQLGSVLQGAAA